MDENIQDNTLIKYSVKHVGSVTLKRNIMRPLAQSPTEVISLINNQCFVLENLVKSETITREVQVNNRKMQFCFCREYVHVKNAKLKR
jgi:hypothetical protein